MAPKKGVFVLELGSSPQGKGLFLFKVNGFDMLKPRLWPTICLWTHWLLHRCTFSSPVSFSTSGFSPVISFKMREPIELWLDAAIVRSSSVQIPPVGIMDSATEMKLLDFLRQTDEEWTETLKLAKAVGKTRQSHSASSVVASCNGWFSGWFSNRIQPSNCKPDTQIKHQTTSRFFLGLYPLVNCYIAIENGH